MDQTEHSARADFEQRLNRNEFTRPPYAYCVYHSAALAKRLGYDEISVLEFGVAGGKGLLALESYAEEVAAMMDLRIQVYGFDTGTGLPAPVDYRDLPYHWQPGFFEMDEQLLRSRLRSAELVLGDVARTATEFFTSRQPAPVAAVMHDLDLYSSTAASLTVFDAPEQTRLPRVFCYFDDILGDETELYNDFTGERLAIREFNDAHARRKLSEAYHLTTRVERRKWYHQIYLLHDFEHSRYNQFVSEENQQLPLPEGAG